MRPRRKTTNFGPIILGICGLLFIFAIGGYVFYTRLFLPVNVADQAVKAFVIEQGTSTVQIVEDLEKQGLIRSGFAFRIALKNSGKADKIIPGDYKLSPSMSTQKIVEELTSGPDERWVTLIEGWRNEQMAERLFAQLGIQKEDFLKVAKEGYMFPDTYLFSPEVTAQEVAARMRANVDRKYTAELQAKIRAQGLTPEQGVILASLVEQEARTDKVRTEVASIMLKRLTMGMKLDIDATVRFAMDSEEYKKSGKVEKYWQPIRQSDYSTVISPFNTYLNNGLPPAPICNPSLSSLNAVANADPKTPYVFYFHNLKGETYYGETLDEHNANIAKYR